MTLKELIDALARCDPDLRVPVGFGRPCSYRGYYDELAFVIEYDTTVGAMLAHARSALGKTFTGYKGGSYVMHEYTDCWLVQHYSACGEGIGPVLLAYMTGVVEGMKARDAA